ncbi:MAG: glycosyltransferase [Gammaproteobacteria bacterium]|nr:glycosyltransferase [Gammaproteobacteria bacterium]
MKVALCICTYQRPQGLQKLLDSLTQLQDSKNVEIVVADNHPKAEGIEVCQSLPDDYPFLVHTTTVPSNGISYARNAAIDKALELQPTHLAFLDDDEWPSPHWLKELLRVLNAQNADVVGGPTVSVFPENAPESLKTNPYFGADLGLADGEACQLEAAGNFLIRKDALDGMGPEYFHIDFAQSGGEDLAFFTQLAQRGARMHWAANATVSESVPSNRISNTWLRTRVINIANSRVRVMQLLEPGMISASIRGLKTLALGIVAMAMSVLGLLHADSSAKAQLLRWKFIGKFTAHLRQKTVRGEGH